MVVRTRFAPSPTGLIHVGSLYSVLLDYAFAKKHGGQFIVRIEDTDVKRQVKGAEEKIYEALDWLGIKENESPRTGGSYGPYRQSERLEIYQKHAQKLIKKGQAYYCFCSSARLEKVRREKQKKDLPPMYDRHCRDLTTGEAEKRVEKEKYVIRMKIPDNEKIVVDDLIRGRVVFESKVLDDQVLIKSDGYPTYHLAATVDDHLMKISHVVRGEEWLSSAPKHLLLYRYFGWKPPIILHTPIIRDETRKKLSKRQGHTALDWYQKQGYLPEALINFLCLLGWSHPEEKDIFSLEEFIKYFDLKDVSPVGPVFDLKKLDWMNGAYIRKKSNRELVQIIGSFAPKGMTGSLINQTIPLVKERLVKLVDYPGLVDFLVKEPEIEVELLVKKGGNDKELVKEQLSTISNQQLTIKEWTAENLEKLFRDLATKNNWYVGKFFMATRIAITGRTITPPLFESMALLGREKTIRRIKKAIALVA